MAEIRSALTDGTGVSDFTSSKVVKDFVVDVLIGAAAGLAAVGVTNIPTDQAGLTVATFAVAKAVISAVYRAVLKWGQS